MIETFEEFAFWWLIIFIVLAGGLCVILELLPYKRQSLVKKWDYREGRRVNRDK